VRVCTLLLCCVCLFFGGFAAGCGAKKARKPQWKTVTVNGRTLIVTEIGTVTLDTNP
jgi:hypothetical protein